jgi:putative addiction module antidote
MALAHRKLQRIGNSTGIVISADLLREAGLAQGDEVIVRVEKGRVVITALDPDFDELVAAADRFVSDHPNALKKLGE